MTKPTRTLLPDELNDAIMKLHAIDARVTEVNKLASSLTTDRRLAELAVIAMLDDAGLSMAALDNGVRVERRNKVVHNVAPGGWPSVYARIQLRGEFDLLQKRLSSTAVRERFAAGDRIDGIVEITIPELKLSGG